MDLGYPMDRPYQPIPPDLAGPAHRIASFLGGGGRAVVVTGPARSGKRTLLDGLLAGMPGRVTRIENRSRLPLALDAVLKQMGKLAETEGDERGLFFRTLAEQAYDDYSAVIAVEDAHTLTTLAVTALARAPGLGGPDLPGMILLLTGEPSLLEKLDGPGLEGLRNSRRTLMVALPGPGVVGEARPAPNAPPLVAPNPVHATPILAVPDEEMSWSRGNLGMRAIVIAIFAGAIAAAGGLMWSVFAYRPLHPVAMVAAMEPPAPAAAEPAAVAPAAVPTPMTEVQPPTALPTLPPLPLAQALAPPDAVSPPIPAPEVALRQEFDAFLNRAGRDTAKLSPAAREVLFREYRQWRARGAAEARAP